MNESLQEQAVRIFREQLGGFYTPSGLLALLGLHLMTPLRTIGDLLRLSDEDAKRAIEILPTLQRSAVPTSDIAPLIT